MQTTTTPADEAHATVRFSSDEWGVLKREERGRAVHATRETAATGAKVARKVRRTARHRLNCGMKRLTDPGPVVLAWPEEGARGDVWVGMDE
ncbi:hypothetical protein [Salinibacter ruber]|jgi:hypothetical protein|uniref:hypothetical protein n=1 Tax=Salinibacter ruber TaxID=146919 RepID=UPI000E574715|nr:hypothetical protein [Salinibacter ruber]